MGMLAAFAGGAAQGVQSHWADIKEKVAAEAKQAFEERMVQVRADAQVNSAKQQQENAFAFEQETLPKRLDMAEQTATRTAETENSLLNKYAPDANAREADALRGKLTVEQEFAKPEPIDIGEKFVTGPNGQPMKVKFDKRTGQLIGDAIPAYRGGKGSGGNGSYKPDLKDFIDPADPSGDTKIPNVRIDTVTGMVVDPSGTLLSKTIKDEDIKNTIDAEVKQRKDGVAWTTKNDSKAFGEGVDEAAFRKAREQQLRNEAPTLADLYGIDPSRVVSSVNEIRSRMANTQISGMMTQADQLPGEQPAPQQGLVFD
ncbi:MAG: hypothetical protein RQ732_09855, partial [Methylophaga sp.]|nr:hypothetical protein [Methylophaga sp.]